MFQVHKFVFNPFQENTYILYDETRECVIIDPGSYDTEEQKTLKDFIDQKQLTVKLLLNTHCHIDHVLGNAFVKNTYQVNFLIHASDEPVLRAQKIYASHYGFHSYHEALPDAFMKQSDVIKFGNQSLLVLFVPGHSPGHVAFYNDEAGVLIGGDVLFLNSIGRTDLPGGNHDTLINSIHTKFFTLPDAVKVFCGHGPETTIGYEKRTNPFCAIVNTR